jgi:hypothetical protein
MTDRINGAEKLETIIEQLSDSVLDLSDEAILAEITESGADPRQEAERIRLVLRQAARQQSTENKRFLNRHDTRNSGFWRTPKEGRSG